MDGCPQSSFLQSKKGGDAMEDFLTLITVLGFLLTCIEVALAIAQFLKRK